MLTWTASDGGEFSAYLALGSESPRPLIVLLPEIFGLTPWIKKTVADYAGHGFCVAAIEVFSRLERDFLADYRDPSQVEKALSYRGQLDHRLAVDDIACAIRNITAMPECNGKSAVIGYCLGGTLAFLAAARLNVDLSVAYYGTQIHEVLEEGANIRRPCVLHMGLNDNHVPPALSSRIRAALADNPQVTIFDYAAGHGFANCDRADYYKPTASDLALSRTHEYLAALV